MTNRPAALWWTFGYGALWGGFTIFVALTSQTKYPSQAIVIVTAILGVMTVIFAFAVLQRRMWAAWALVALAGIDILSRLSHGGSGAIMPLLLLAFAWTATRRLKTSPTSN